MDAFPVGVEPYILYKRGNNKFYKRFPYRVFRKAGLCVRKVL